MTLEEAEGRVDAILMEATASGEEHPPAKRDAEALRVVLAVARAFPKMLETLKRAEWSGIQHHSGASCCPFCGATMGSGVHGVHCSMDDALRAAREAVKP